MSEPTITLTTAELTDLLVICGTQRSSAASFAEQVVTEHQEKLEAMPHQEAIAHAVHRFGHHPGIEHIWLNALSCVSPTGAFCGEVGDEVIRKVMAANPRHEDVLGTRRHVLIRFNAS
jgi:hypothetical protein